LYFYNLYKLSATGLALTKNAFQNTDSLAW